MEFQLADEYVTLQSVMEPRDTLGWILLWNDMIVQPLWLFVSFLYGTIPSKISLAMTVWRTVMIWKKWARYQVLRETARDWVLQTKARGGPWISCNDPTYHVYVYADAMLRLRSRPHQLRRSLPPEKRLKA